MIGQSRLKPFAWAWITSWSFGLVEAADNFGSIIHTTTLRSHENEVAFTAMLGVRVRKSTSGRWSYVEYRVLLPCLLILSGFVEDCLGSDRQCPCPLVSAASRFKSLSLVWPVSADSLESSACKWSCR